MLVSPCDGIVGAMGPVVAGSVLQAKGFPYTLMDLLGDAELVRKYLEGTFVTLRLRSACITASTRRTTAASSR